MVGKRVLVFSRTTGYRHESIPTGVAALRELGVEHRLDVDATEDATAFAAGNLERYSAVVFLSTSGEVFNDDQRRALAAYVRGGGGYVGVHGAATTEYGWGFYGDLVGARFRRHPPAQVAVLDVEDRAHQATRHLADTWTWKDEYYDFQPDPRRRVHVLLSVDESTYDGGEMGPGHPIAWCHEVGAGRCFYTALGHADQAFSAPEFRDHLHGGIQYALGVEQ